MTTLVIDSHKYSKKALTIYKSLGPVFVIKELEGNAQLLKKISKKIDILVVRNLTQVDKKLIDSLPNIKIVASPTTGHNHLDVAYLKKKNIKIISLRGRKSFLKDITSTAEQTLALLLALYRHIPWDFDAVRAGDWPRDEFIGNQLKDKTIGILGYGRLGKIVKRYAKAFHMNVTACDPNVSKERMLKEGVKKVTIKTLLKTSDIVSLHVLLTDDTYDLLTSKHFRLMKKDAVFINTARAEIVERGAIYTALKNKWIRGAAIDVMHDENMDGSHLKRDPLYAYAKKNKNLLISSHLGGVSFEAMAATEDFIAGLVESHALKARKR